MPAGVTPASIAGVTPASIAGVMQSPRLASAGNLLFGSALPRPLVATSRFFTENMLHPKAPVTRSGSGCIHVFFTILLNHSLLVGVQVAWWWRKPRPGS